MLNILIAVVSEAYDGKPEAQARLYWRSRFDLVVRTSALWEPFFHRATIKKKDVKRIIKVRFQVDPENKLRRRYDAFGKDLTTLPEAGCGSVL